MLTVIKRKRKLLEGVSKVLYGDSFTDVYFKFIKVCILNMYSLYVNHTAIKIKNILTILLLYHLYLFNVEDHYIFYVKSLGYIYIPQNIFIQSVVYIFDGI